MSISSAHKEEGGCITRTTLNENACDATHILLLAINCIPSQPEMRCYLSICLDHIYQETEIRFLCYLVTRCLADLIYVFILMPTKAHLILCSLALWCPRNKHKQAGMLYLISYSDSKCVPNPWTLITRRDKCFGLPISGPARSARPH